MKKTLTLLFCSFVLIGCQSEAAQQRETETITLFNKNCAGCHGLDLSGTALGGNIRGFSKKEILQVIENGDEEMPANILTGENADRVAAWVAKQK